GFQLDAVRGSRGFQDALGVLKEILHKGLIEPRRETWSGNCSISIGGSKWLKRRLKNARTQLASAWSLGTRKIAVRIAMTPVTRWRFRATAIIRGALWRKLFSAHVG